MNIIFVCSQNKLRSPTAENIYQGYKNINVRSAGLNNDAEVRINCEDVKWADIVFLMEQRHKNKLMKLFRNEIKNQKLIVLSIPDEYEYMDQELVEIIKRRVKKYLPVLTDQKI